MAFLKYLRYFSVDEKTKAEKQLVGWMSGQFDLPEGETYEAIAKDAVIEASKEKVIDSFNERAMIESLVFKSRTVIANWVE